MPSNLSIFTIELLAVLNALVFIFNNYSNNKFVIHTDCRSVLSSLKDIFSVNQIVCEIHDWLVLLANRRKISILFCWVPSHVGVRENELANVAAKAATRLARINRVDIPFSDMRTSIRIFSREKWQMHWENLDSNYKLKSIKPSIFPCWSPFQGDRRSSIILTRLRIGHTFLSHRYLMASGEERQVPLCSTCREVYSVKHILIDCPDFNSSRRDNLLVGYSLKDILGESAPVERILKFLKDINRFYDI